MEKVTLGQVFFLQVLPFAPVGIIPPRSVLVFSYIFIRNASRQGLRTLKDMCSVWTEECMFTFFYASTGQTVKSITEWSYTLHIYALFIQHGH